MKRTLAITTLAVSLLAVLCAFALHATVLREQEPKSVKVGFVYIGDAAGAYTQNFLTAAENVEHKYGESVEVLEKYNIPRQDEAEALQQLLDAGCELIFATSADYAETTKLYAQQNPDVQFCQAAASNANTEPVLDNYHTFMGEIYEGRYATGVVAGLKLQQLIDSGEITAGEAKVGYVAAHENAEVISGYTAFFLGVRSVVPQATMEVLYTDAWGSYADEKLAAQRLIERGCVILSQHSDTRGPAVACEETDASTVIYHVGYNRSMTDVAPSTSLTSCRINWTPYIVSAVGAVLDEKPIESSLNAHIHGHDAGGGFAEGWVEMLELNDSIAPEGTTTRLGEVIEQFKKGKIDVFSGNYTGVDPFDPADTIDLNSGYTENADSSAPTFHYVLKDVITIVE